MPECAPDCIARRAEIDGEIELAQHHGQPIGKFARDAFEQKIRQR
jgi:hypothetical protein